jgi:hypothetical protein
LRDRESGEQEYVRFTIEGTEGIRPLQHYSDASGTGFFVAMVVSNHELNFDADVRAVTGGSILSQANTLLTHVPMTSCLVPFTQHDPFHHGDYTASHTLPLLQYAVTRQCLKRPETIPLSALRRSESLR